MLPAARKRGVIRPSIHSCKGAGFSRPERTRRSRLVRQVRQPIIEDFIVNKDQVKGAAKDIAGKIQQETGKLTGNTGQQVKGLKNQAEGKSQKAVGDLKEAVSDLKKAVKQD